MSKVLTSLGLMSGTSMDGIDAAIVKTDGEKIFMIGPSFCTSYIPEIKFLIKKAVEEKQDIDLAEEAITLAHAEVVNNFLMQLGMSKDDIDIIGFHGHTIDHDPDNGKTLQIGNGKLLAKQTGIDVVCDFRSNDVKNGGQGAPLVPIYQKILFDRELNNNDGRPIVVLNIGGISNITYIDGSDDNLIAMDTGMGNALLDSWMQKNSDKDYDKDGEVSQSGNVDNEILNKMFENPFFDKAPPKSLDRLDFSIDIFEGLSLEDGAATIVAFTTEAVNRSFDYLPETPSVCYVTGGGRLNKAIMNDLSERLPCKIINVDDIGYDGDALEAQAFALLAVRSKYNMPITFASTTGVSRNIVEVDNEVMKSSATGGVFCPV